jgi:hypothetical protein
MASSSSSKYKRVYISTKTGEIDSRALLDRLDESERASALFRFLYNGGNEKLDLNGSELELTGPAFGRAVGDYYVPTEECDKIPNRDPRSPFGWTIKPESQYLQRLNNITTNYGDLGIFVDQRAFGITSAASKHRLICTFGVWPCIVVVLYDRVRKVAAMGHFDEAQDYTSIEDMIDAADFRGSVIDVHFYGGCIDEGADDKMGASCNTSTKALEVLLNASAKLDVKLVICSFNVLARTHGSGITFDPENGAFYGFGTSARLKVAPADFQYINDPEKKRVGMEQPLDSRFRMWPNGEYFVSKSGREQSDKQKSLIPSDGVIPPGRMNTYPGDMLSESALSCGRSIGIIPSEPLAQPTVVAHARRARCVWNANPGKRGQFVNDVQELVSKLVIWQAVSTDESLAIAFDGLAESAGAKSMKAMVDYLNERRKPMALEDSLKRWLKGRELLEEAGGVGFERAKELAKVAKELLKNNVVDIIQEELIASLRQPPSSGSSSSSPSSRIQPSPEGTVAAIHTAVENWLWENPHPWEAEMQEPKTQV